MKRVFVLKGKERIEATTIELNAHSKPSRESKECNAQTETSMTYSLDFSVLEDLANHDAAKVRKYALLFVSSLEEVLVLIDGGIANADTALLGAMGHRAKSTAKNVGATALADQCLRLEEAAKANDAATAIAVAKDLRGLFLPIRAEILAYLDG